MAALTVQGGLVKNKLKGGGYNKPPIMNRMFFSIETVPPNNFFGGGTVPPNNFFGGGTIPPNSHFQVLN